MLNDSVQPDAVSSSHLLSHLFPGHFVVVYCHRSVPNTHLHHPNQDHWSVTLLLAYDVTHGVDLHLIRFLGDPTTVGLVLSVAVPYPRVKRPPVAQQMHAM